MERWKQSSLESWFALSKLQDQQAQKIVSGLTPEQITSCPTANQWSIAQIFEHLAKTFELYRPFILKAIERAEANPHQGFPPAYTPGRFARWFIRMAGPDGRSLRAPKIFRPHAGGSEKSLSSFLDAQESYRRTLQRADSIHINRWKLRSPVTPLLRFRIGEALELYIRHNERHLGQAEATKMQIAVAPPPETAPEVGESEVPGAGVPPFPGSGPPDPDPFATPEPPAPEAAHPQPPGESPRRD